MAWENCGIDKLGLAVKFLKAVQLNFSQEPGDENWCEVVSIDELGKAIGRDGREWTADLKRIEARFRADGLELPIDLEHASHIKAPKGDAAPAYGWASDVRVEGNKLLAKIQWNSEGGDLVKSKKYRYLSPGFTEAGNEIVALVSLALTNVPNFSQPALNRSESPMNKKILEKLGLKEDATDVEIEAAIEALTQAKQSPPKVNEEEGGGPNANPKDVPPSDSTALNANQTPISVGQYQAVVDRCNMQEVALNRFRNQETEAMVDSAIKSGKILPAIRNEQITLCNALGVKGYQAYLEKLPTIVNGEKNQQNPQGLPGSLNQTEIQVCRLLGTDPEKYKQAQKEG